MKSFLEQATGAFDVYHQRYDAWFEHHAQAYYSELLAVRALLPWHGLGLEIGVGSGRFAAPLGVPIGIDPAGAMLEYATKRGVAVVQGVAEMLPFPNGCFDYLLSVTTICFVDDANAMLREAYRVLKPGGELVIGFVDRDSELGQHYLAHQRDNVFYREAHFFSAGEVAQLLDKLGFEQLIWAQTLSKSLDEIHAIEPLRVGYGQCAFVVVKARRLH